MSLGARAHVIAIVDDLAYVAHVVDVFNPLAPSIVSVKRFPTPVWDVAVKGAFVYAVTFGGEMYVLHVSTPTTPRQVKVIGLVAWRATHYNKCPECKFPSRR